jgi:hypothetical protein
VHPSISIFLSTQDHQFEQAKTFYLHYRFEESLDDPMRLFLPMRDIRALLSKTGACRVING